GAPASGRRAVLILLALLSLAAVAAMVWMGSSPAPTAPAPAQIVPARTAPPQAPIDAQFIGSQACAACHAAQFKDWSGSQHHAAMAAATETTVLGNFRDARLRHAGVESSFFRRDGKYFVRTDGPDGKLADFEVSRVFGVYPLQQYLTEFPDGRVQVLPLAWDARAREQGGQRWFHVHPDEKLDHRDELHWTRPAYNWNHMCADCHSTEVRKGYDAAANAYRSGYREISVGCEACHGPGSAHAAWAKGGAEGDPQLTVRLDGRRGGAWTIDAATGNARRSAPRPHEREIEVCAQCHARRGQIAEGYVAGRPFLDHYRPALPLAPLYHADGQQRDEVFIWGSFLQSKMYQQGVSCADCHDPHTGKTRAQGNAVCAQCHLPAKYDTAAHTQHAAGKPGSQCVDCHMPATTYMVVDPRRDHGFRIPRPDLTASTGAPNACGSCHAKQGPAWAAEQIRQRWGGTRPGLQRYAEALAAAERGAASAPRQLVAVLADPTQPAIARAAALQALADSRAPQAGEELRRAVASPEPLLRLAAAHGLVTLPAEARVAVGAPLLSDPLRVIRIDTAAALAGAAPESLAAHRVAYERALAEFMQAQRLNADRPEARATLGNHYAATGDAAGAEREWRAAIALEPQHVPAYVNLADLQRALGQGAASEATLRAGLKAVPGDASLLHALGLAQVRSGQKAAALDSLRQAAQRAPQAPRYAYVYAVALNDAGRDREAQQVLETTLARWPDDLDARFFAVQVAQARGDAAGLQRHLTELAQRHGTDPQVRAFLGSLQARPPAAGGAAR
ncbi:MAG TPA: multiheme c-type cytochrome, partial [Burkholderiaceae bacterium]|nr:multiheme c-type cytochrome [Burkholderiaceae bacterium]